MLNEQSGTMAGQQLAKAKFRLAGLLNSIWPSGFASAQNRTSSIAKLLLPAAKRPFIPAREAGAAVFGLRSSPGRRSLWGKPGLGGFEPARGEAPIEAGFEVKVLVTG
jgi:hypothetical protein